MGHRKGAGPEAATTGLEAREPIGVSNATSSKASSPRPQAGPRPVFALTIEYAGTPEFAIHGLRKLLKRLLRDHHFRARSLEQIGGPQ